LLVKQLISGYFSGWIGTCSVIELATDRLTGETLELNPILLMAGGGDQGGGGMFMLIWMVLIFAIMYLLLIRPQRKKQKEHERLLSELKKGDKVVTSGGMFATIFAIDEDRGRVVLKLGDDTKLEFLKSSIAGKVEN
jgi:preprotein translocase subunit YajC